MENGEVRRIVLSSSTIFIFEDWQNRNQLRILSLQLLIIHFKVDNITTIGSPCDY